MKDGYIEIRDKLVDNRLTRSAFVAAFPDAELFSSNPPAAIYRLRHVTLRGRTMVVLLNFSDERLVWMSFTEPEDYKHGWDEISEARLQEHKSKNDKWLADAFGIVGGQSDFPGGEVRSIADLKTGASSIFMIFHEQ